MQSKDLHFEPYLCIDKTQIVSDIAFEKMYFNQKRFIFNMASKCVQKDIYLNALNLVNIKRKVTNAEDILAVAMILGVSKKIALLNDALYFYAFNNDSITKHSAKMQERIENLSFVIAELQKLATKKDRQYEVFIGALAKALEFHIIGNKMQKWVLAYEKRIQKGYLKFIARLILSLQKKPLRIKQKERELKRFIKQNESVFRF